MSQPSNLSLFRDELVFLLGKSVSLGLRRIFDLKDWSTIRDILLEDEHVSGGKSILRCFVIERSELKLFVRYLTISKRIDDVFWLPNREGITLLTTLCKCSTSEFMFRRHNEDNYKKYLLRVIEFIPYNILTDTVNALYNDSPIVSLLESMAAPGPIIIALFPCITLMKAILVDTRSKEEIEELLVSKLTSDEIQWMVEQPSFEELWMFCSRMKYILKKKRDDSLYGPFLTNVRV